MCSGEFVRDAVMCLNETLNEGPDGFDVLTLVVTMLAIVVPVVITLVLWRFDRRNATDKAERDRRGALFVAYGQMLADLIDREDDPEPTGNSQLVRLITGVSTHASSGDAEVVAWLIRRARKVIRLVNIEMTEQGVKADVDEAADSAVEALARLGQWREDPSTVDFSQLDTDI